MWLAEIRNFSSSVEVFFNMRREIKTNKIPNHFTFAAKSAINYVTIETLIFSRVKISCFRSKALGLVFHMI